MFFSRLSLLLVLAQTAAVGYALLAAETAKTLYHLMIYGSPVHLAMGLFSGNSVLLEGNPVIVGLAAFHVVKYFCFFRARVGEEVEWSFYLAAVLEALYLAYSAYRLL